MGLHTFSDTTKQVFLKFQSG